MNLNNQPTIYFIPLITPSAKKKAIFSFEKLFTHYIFKLIYTFRAYDLVGLKTNFITPVNYELIEIQYLQKIIELLNHKNIAPFLCQTLNNYSDQSNHAIKLLKMMNESGYSYENFHLPSIILDGVNGSLEQIFDLGKNFKNPVYLSKELTNIDGMILLNQPEAHSLCGFKGALFNLGEGLASRRGKIKQYSQSKPQSNSYKCHGCRKCKFVCPVHAIKIENDCAQIDYDRCIDCGKCVDIARYGGIFYEWDATSDHFSHKMLEHALGAVKIMENKIVYINFLTTTDGDGKQDPLGVLVGKDPVAIDQATIDLAAEYNIIISDPEVNLQQHFEYAVEIGIGSNQYQLETIAY